MTWWVSTCEHGNDDADCEVCQRECDEANEELRCEEREAWRNVYQRRRRRREQQQQQQEQQQQGTSSSSSSSSSLVIVRFVRVVNENKTLSLDFCQRKTECQRCKESMPKGCLRVGKLEKGTFHGNTVNTKRYFHIPCWHQDNNNNNNSSSSNTSNTNSQCQNSQHISTFGGFQNLNHEIQAIVKESNASSDKIIMAGTSPASSDASASVRANGDGDGDGAKKKKIRATASNDKKRKATPTSVKGSSNADEEGVEKKKKKRAMKEGEKSE